MTDEHLQRIVSKGSAVVNELCDLIMLVEILDCKKEIGNSKDMLKAERLLLAGLCPYNQKSIDLNRNKDRAKRVYELGLEGL